MQGYLASGYVGQSLKLAIGKTNVSARLAYMDSPSSHTHKTLSTRHQHGIEPLGSTYWPGHHNGQLVLDHFPRIGPLSHPHYLVRKHRERHQKHSDHQKSDTSTSSSDSQAQDDHSGMVSSTPVHEEHHHEIQPQYETTKRGQLLPLKEYDTYHSSMQKGATMIFQAPQPFAINSAKRSLIEADKPVIAAESDMRLLTSAPRMVVASFEAGVLKSQRRANERRVSAASKDIFRDTLPTPSPGSPLDPTTRMEQLLEEQFGQESFSIEDIITLQRMQKERHDDPYFLLPQLTHEDIKHYEAKLEGVREALEERWSLVHAVGRGPNSGVHPSLYRLWPRPTRTHLTQMVTSFHLTRRSELMAFIEALNTALKDSRKGNPHGKKGSTHRRKSDSSPNPTPEDQQSLPKNETWPLAFDEDPLASQQPTINIDSLGEAKTTRSVLLALALYANSTLTHPLPSLLVRNICNFVLQPLGYGANPHGAQVLLTHLGMPVVDPLEVPSLFNIPKSENVESFKLSRPYPWLKSKEQQTIGDFLNELVENSENQPQLSLESVSPRHAALKASINLSPSSSSRASEILAESVSSISESVSKESAEVIDQILRASKSPAFHFSTHAQPLLETSPTGSPMVLPSLMTDSSRILSSIDLDRDTRVDISALTSYAIDDKSTTEVDDAFALDLNSLLPYSDWILNHLSEYTKALKSNGSLPSSVPPPPASMPKTAKIYIHIADPTTVMRPGDALELGARERVETMYLPHRKSFMLPSILSEYYCSLLPGSHTNLGLTFEAQVNILTGALEHMEVFPSKFSGMKRFDYGAVQECIMGASNEVITGNDALSIKLLREIARMRTHWRFEVGKASTMQMAKARVHIEAQGSKHTLSMVSENDFADSRSLVEEMMVLVGEITGRMSLEHGFAVPYRNMPHLSPVHLPSLDWDLAGAKHNPMLPTHQSVLECSITRMLLVHNLQSLNLRSSSETSGVPSIHCSLGLPVYSRASSPLRRYADVIAHMQLKAWRRYGGDMQKMPFSNGLVRKLSQHINEVSKDIKYTQKTSERWWKNQYVLRHGMDRTFDALVFSSPDLVELSLLSFNRTLNYSIYILEIDVIVHLPTPFPLADGQIVKLKPTATSELTLEWSVVEPVAL